MLATRRCGGRGAGEPICLRRGSGTGPWAEYGGWGRELPVVSWASGDVEDDRHVIGRLGLIALVLVGFG
jgi:hypothetical protein